MAHVGVRELRSALATFMRRAASGERVVITVDGRPVAELGPAGIHRDTHATTLADLVARGAVVAPRRRGEWIAPEPVSLWTGVRIDRALDEVRR